jgi:hypothetical protein
VKGTYKDESMAGYSSLYGREISEKIRDIEYQPFIKVCPKNV